MSGNSLALHSLDDVERLARIAITSGLTQLRRPEEAAVILMTGHELGLSPMQALRGIYVVSGRPVLSADLMVAVVRRSGLCDSWRTVESTPERCEIETRRKGEEHPMRRVWTMGDAKRAGITGKGTWAAYPAAMLRHRCAADLAREVYPDVLLGLYDPEELGDAPDAPQSADVVQAPASWRDDLSACESLRDVRGAYAMHSRPALGRAEPDTSAMRDDVREWCASHGVPGVTAAEATALLTTMPDAALAVLDELHLDVEREPEARCVEAARAVKVARWDDHSVHAAHTIVARCYAALTAQTLRTAAAKLVALRDASDAPALPAPTPAQTAEWDAEFARIASKSTKPALVNSIRKHAAEILASHATAVAYATQWARVNAVADDPRTPAEIAADAAAKVRALATAVEAAPRESA